MCLTFIFTFDVVKTISALIIQSVTVSLYVQQLHSRVCFVMFRKNNVFTNHRTENLSRNDALINLMPQRNVSSHPANPTTVAYIFCYVFRG